MNKILIVNRPEFISLDCPPWIVREAKAFVEEGFDVSILTNARGACARRNEVDGIKVHYGNWRCYKTIRYISIGEFLGIIKKVDPDIIHANDFLVAPYAVLASKLVGCPVVLNLHEASWAALINEAEVSPIIKKLSHMVYFVIEFLLLRLANKVITVIDEASWLLQKRYGIKEEKIQVVINVPDPKNMTGLLPANNTELEGKFVIIYCGSIDKLRNLDIVIRAMDNIRNENIVLLIVGRPTLGFETHYAELRALASSLSLLNKVKFVDWLPRREALSYVMRADVCLLLHKKTFFTEHTIPLKLHEYAALGKPIVTTPLNPVLRLYGDAVAVWDGVSPESFARVIEDLYHNGKRRRILGRKAMNLYLRKYNWNIEKKKLLAMYKNMYHADLSIRGLLRS